MIFRKKQKNKKWEKRPQLYKGRFYYFRKLAQFLLILAIVGLCVGVVFYLKNSETLFIKSVEILGEYKNVDPREIALLSQITPEDKLFSIDLEEVANHLYRHPWIATVQVRREFPGKIQIRATEREPYIYVVADDIYIADKNGVIFKKKEEKENYNLPVITGFTKDFVKSYPKITKIYFDEILEFYKKIQTAKFYKHNMISQIHRDLTGGLTVFAGDRDLEIFYGKDFLQEKQAKLDQIDNTDISVQFARLDLNLDNRIIARKRNYEQKK